MVNKPFFTLVYIYMSRPFRRPNPNLFNSDYIRNKKGKVRYNNMVNVAVNKKCSSFDGKTKIDCDCHLLNTDSYETLLSFRYGRELCPPCDISGLVTEPGDIAGVLNKCPCRITMTDRMRSTLYHMISNIGTSVGPPAPLLVTIAILAQLGMGPDYMYLPWNPLQKPGSNNANDTWWAPEDPSVTEYIFSIMDVSENAFGWCPFKNIIPRMMNDNNVSYINPSDNWIENTLPYMDASGDCSGSFCGPSLVSIYGGHMKIRGTVIRGCSRANNTSYLPPGTFSFNVRDLLGSWLYLWESFSASNPNFQVSVSLPVAPWLWSAPLSEIINDFHRGGIYGARPPTTRPTYLRNFARRGGPLRFYRSKHWHA